MIFFPGTKLSHYFEDEESGSDYEKENLKEPSESSSESETDVYEGQCKHCDKTFKVKENLIKHIISKHSNQKRENTTKFTPVNSKPVFFSIFMHMCIRHIFLSNQIHQLKGLTDVQEQRLN